jgi:dTDP-4-dehydrorhamnose 3,5-epimerase
MIDGVVTKPLKRNSDERGFLMEILRSDDEVYEKFAQVYISLNYPGVIRAWHYHLKQTDFFAVVKGMAKVVLFDARKGSPTQGEVNELFLGDNNNMLLRIPIGVYHGYKTIGTEPTLLLNFPTELYDTAAPDEFRVPYNSPDVPYNWDLRNY